jgi:hypothetical protein
MRKYLRPVLIGWIGLILSSLVLPPPPAGAAHTVPPGSSAPTLPATLAAPRTDTDGAGRIAAEALIVLKPAETGNYKLVNLIELARLINSAGPDGLEVPAGATFSFLQSGLMGGDYVPGWNTAHELVLGGGVCAGSTLIATLVAEAGRRGAPLALTQRVRHTTYEPAYHQVNVVGGRAVPVVDAAVNDTHPRQDLRWANHDTAAYALRVFLLTDPGDGSLLPLDEARVWAEYRRDPLGPLARPVYFYGRLVRLP